MLRLVLAQALRRRGRSFAVVAAIVVAAVSFSLLTSAVATSQLRVQGTVQANYRSAYDILVRPANSSTALEKSSRLVQENYLSGIYGGITMGQYHQIQTIPGVQVAAPIAMIGYLMPFENITIPAKPYLTGQLNQLLRLKVTETGDNGLSNYPAPTQYLYVSKQKNPPHMGGDGGLCGMGFTQKLPYVKSAFDLPALTGLNCLTTNPPEPYQGPMTLTASFSYPVLLAAIDPVQEAKLVGLDQAVVSGRYLTAADKTRTLAQMISGRFVPPSTPGAFIFHQVPVLVANRPLTNTSMTVQVQQVHVPDPSGIAGELAAPKPLPWLTSLPATTVHTLHLTAENQYSRILDAYRATTSPVSDQFWSVGQVSYRQLADGHLSPQPRSNPDPSLWTYSGGYSAPQANSDVGFRRLQVHLQSTHVTNNVFNAPTIHPVGVFDPSKIAGFSSLSKVPLTTYYPPDAAPGDASTARLLHNKSLLPDDNLAGYLQQPPMMLTTIRSLHSFTDPNAFGNVTAFAKAPISVIRVRVAGVTGADPLSLARVRLAAEQIARQTGLKVDITMGSSPHQELINLPAGNHGRPPLLLSEGWVKKGVAVALLSAIDTKSLALFGLVLLVCLLFLLNATVAAVRTRRTELGILSCLGWAPRRIFALLESELVATGFTAGLLGTAIAAILATTLNLHVSWLQIVLITPVATALAAVAGIGPVWRACTTTPMQAITPAVHTPRKASRISSISRLALVGLARWPGRTILGATSLLVGVAALTALIAIQQAFQGGVVGTSLGNVVAIQVRGVDYLAAALTIGLGAFAVADIAYLNISERTAEIATFRSTGWAESHIRQLFATEALLTAATGSIAGAALSITTVSLILPINTTTAITAAATAAAIGITTACLALLLPLTRLAHLAPAAAIIDE